MWIAENAQACQRTESISTVSFNTGFGGNSTFEGLTCRHQSVWTEGLKEQ
jgi:hypothetical protein